MNKFKKRVVKTWQMYGNLVMIYIELYHRKKNIVDLKTACYFYTKYVSIYLLINEHNI